MLLPVQTSCSAELRCPTFGAQHNPRTMRRFYPTTRKKRISTPPQGQDQASPSALGPTRAPEVACGKERAPRTGITGSPMKPQLSDNAVQQNLSVGAKDAQSRIRTKHGPEQYFRKSQTPVTPAAPCCRCGCRASWRPSRQSVGETGAFRQGGGWRPHGGGS